MMTIDLHQLATVTGGVRKESASELEADSLNYGEEMAQAHVPRLTRPKHPKPNWRRALRK